MVKFLHCMVGFIAMLCVAAAQGAQLAYEPVGLGWSPGEVERVTAVQMNALAARAEQAKQLGCTRHCERLVRVFNRLVDQARKQTVRSAALPWSLLVVGLHDIEAIAMPDGRLAISEPFIDLRLQSDEALAFVLAHEMAHSILEHERQALTFARLLLPRQSAHTVQDMYVEMDFNLSLLKAMEPVMQQGEYEADELGLLKASAAGFDPDRQLAFIDQECRSNAGSTFLLATHPPACLRLQMLQSLLPLARRQRPAEGG